MRLLPLIAALIVLSNFCMVICGCGERPTPVKPEKSIIEKLNSGDPIEQRKGLDEADKKYGGGS